VYRALLFFKPMASIKFLVLFLINPPSSGLRPTAIKLAWQKIQIFLMSYKPPLPRTVPFWLGITAGGWGEGICFIYKRLSFKKYQVILSICTILNSQAFLKSFFVQDGAASVYFYPGVLINSPLTPS
jgi:hypothetical protein